MRCLNWDGMVSVSSFSPFETRKSSSTSPTHPKTPQAVYSWLTSRILSTMLYSGPSEVPLELAPAPCVWFLHVSQMVSLDMSIARYNESLSPLSLTLQDFLGQAHFTLGEVVGSLGSRSEKPLGWVFSHYLKSIHSHSEHNRNSRTQVFPLGSSLLHTWSCFPGFPQRSVYLSWGLQHVCVTLRSLRESVFPAGASFKLSELHTRAVVAVCRHIINS